MAAGEFVAIHTDTVQGMFLALADEAIAAHLGDQLKVSDGTAWDSVAHNGTPFIPYPRQAEALVVGHYDGDVRNPAQLRRATFLFPHHARRVEVEAEAERGRYEDYWYRGILEQARAVMGTPHAVGVQAFKIPKPQVVARSMIIKCDVDTIKRYQEIPILKEGA